MPTTYPVGSGPLAITAADFDGDGWLDLAVTNDGSNDVSLLLNCQDGTFELSPSYAVGETPYSITAADMNNDGAVDLIVTNSYPSSEVWLLFNAGNGTFGSSVGL